MKNKTKWLFLILVLLSIGTTLRVTFHFITLRKKTSEQIVLVKDGVYRIGGILLDLQKRQIQFNAYVFKNNGWVQHLIYLSGYKWLKQESAIVSKARLIDLQRAIALLDWGMWDELWQKKEIRNYQLPIIREKELLLFIEWSKKKIPAQKLVLSEDNLEIGDLVFLGSPYFDAVVLETPESQDCSRCPLFSLEEKALRETFIRQSRKSGYELDQKTFPPPRAEVIIIIEIQARQLLGERK